MAREDFGDEIAFERLGEIFERRMLLVADRPPSTKARVYLDCFRNNLISDVSRVERVKESGRR